MRTTDGARAAGVVVAGRVRAAVAVLHPSDARIYWTKRASVDNNAQTPFTRSELPSWILGTSVEYIKEFLIFGI